ncbi:MAG: PHB depolymerase family esterase [Pseudomonadota bacterium]
MTQDLRQLMDDALRLTRAGDLRAATAAITSALGGAGAEVVAGFSATAAAASRAFDADGAIDVESREVHDAPPTGAPARPAAATDVFIAGRHAEAGSARDYKLYIPPQAGSHPLPLVVMLHGCTQDPDDFAAGTAMNGLARAQGFYVLYPAQSQQMNPQRCWNWFKHTHQRRGRGEPALLAGMARAVMAAHAIDSARVYVAGLSAGGAMAAILGTTYPELFAAVGVHSGLAAGAASDLPSALGAMQGGSMAAPGAPSGMPTIVFHGDADSTVNAVNGEQVIAASVGRGAAEQVLPVGGSAGRTATRRVYRAPDGRVLAEHWRVHGAPHAWSGGRAAGSYTDPRGPDASAEMLRFFLEHPHR